MIFLKTQEEIELLRESNRLVGKTLGEISKHILPGVSTLELDRIAEDFIRSFMPMTVRLYYLMSFEVDIGDLAMWSLLVLGIVVIVSLIPLIKTIRTKPRKLLIK